MNKKYFIFVIFIFLAGCINQNAKKINTEIASITNEQKKLSSIYIKNNSFDDRYELIEEYRELGKRILKVKKDISEKIKKKKQLAFGDKLRLSAIEVTSNLASLERGEASLKQKEFQNSCFKTCISKYQPCKEKCGCNSSEYRSEIRWKTHNYGSSHPLRGISLVEYPDTCFSSEAIQCKKDNCLTFPQFEQCHIDCIKTSNAQVEEITSISNQLKKSY